jgi:four helix bundle protein
MVKIVHFEEIKAWQEARKLVQIIYGLSRKGVFAKDFVLRDQVQRAALSTMANIAEGFDSFAGKDFARFLIIARRSVTETQSHLYVALDRQYISQSEFNQVCGVLGNTKSLICGFIRYLKRAGTAD